MTDSGRGSFTSTDLMRKLGVSGNREYVKLASFLNWICNSKGDYRKELRPNYKKKLNYFLSPTAIKSIENNYEFYSYNYSSNTPTDPRLQQQYMLELMKSKDLNTTQG